MKKILFLLFAVFAFAGCSGSDEGDVSGGFDVVGRWEQTYFESKSTGTFIGQKDGTYFRFGSDGSFTFFYSGWGAINSTTAGTYKVEGYGFLRLTYEGGTATVQILQLDESGEAVFLLDGLHTGTYKFRKM